LPTFKSPLTVVKSGKPTAVNALLPATSKDPPMLVTPVMLRLVNFGLFDKTTDELIGVFELSDERENAVMLLYSTSKDPVIVVSLSSEMVEAFWIVILLACVNWPAATPKPKAPPFELIVKLDTDSTEMFTLCKAPLLARYILGAGPLSGAPKLGTVVKLFRLTIVIVVAAIGSANPICPSAANAVKLMPAVLLSNEKLRVSRSGMLERLKVPPIEAIEEDVSEVSPAPEELTCPVPDISPVMTSGPSMLMTPVACGEITIVPLKVGQDVILAASPWEVMVSVGPLQAFCPAKRSVFNIPGNQVFQYEARPCTLAIMEYCTADFQSIFLPKTHWERNSTRSNDSMLRTGQKPSKRKRIFKI
jgi:hypothetical protein